MGETTMGYEIQQRMQRHGKRNFRRSRPQYVRRQTVASRSKSLHYLILRLPTSPAAVKLILPRVLASKPPDSQRSLYRKNVRQRGNIGEMREIENGSSVIHSLAAVPQDAQPSDKRAASRRAVRRWRGRLASEDRNVLISPPKRSRDQAVQSTVLADHYASQPLSRNGRVAGRRGLNFPVLDAFPLGWGELFLIPV